MLFPCVLLVMVKQVVAQTETGGGSGGVLQFISILLTFAGLLALGCSLHSKLLKKDALLPENKRYMSESKQCMFWILYICFCWMCAGCIFYCFADRIITKRLKSINMGDAGKEVAIDIAAADNLQEAAGFLNALSGIV